MALTNEAGSVLTRAQVNALTESADSADPLLRVTANIYVETEYAGASTTSRQLKYRPGDLVKTSELDALYATPVVDAVAPAGGPAAGGTAITITGSGFIRGRHLVGGIGESGKSVGVNVGGVAATSVKVVSDTTITCVTPAHAAGAVTVQVTAPAGNGSKATAFTYA